MIITIDGPSATGKTTVARLLAQEYGINHLSTGYIFRAIAFILQEQEIVSLNIIQKLSINDLKNLIYYYDWQYNFDSIAGISFKIKNFDITNSLSSPQIATFASLLGGVITVRDLVYAYAREFAQHFSLVADGRDCGTEIFSQTPYKFFLTADLFVRGHRFQKFLFSKNIFVTLEQAIIMIQDRDTQDTNRACSPLRIAPDAYIIDTSNLSAEEVVTTIDLILNS